MPVQAAPLRISWSGAGRARLGGSLAAASKALGRPVTSACGRRAISARGLVVDDLGGRAGTVSGIHTRARGITGPLGVRVGMSAQAARRAMGRRSSTFSARGRRGRLLVGAKHHTLWVLDASARVHRVGAFGLAISKAAALRAARAADCRATPAPPADTIAPSPPAPSDTSTPAPAPADPAPADPTPTTPTTPAQCPATLPTVGPYMRVKCDETTQNKVEYTCHPDWRDPDQDPSDGCEAEKDGLQTMWFQNWSAIALQDHVLGTFRMDGYAGGDFPMTTSDWGIFEGANPTTVEVPPSCGSDPSVGCPDGQPQDPPPTLQLDLAKYPADQDRSVISPTGAPQPTGSPYNGTGTGFTQANGTARFRLSTTAPIPFTFSGNSCELAIDSTKGSFPDVTLSATLARTVDPNTGQGLDGPPQLSNVTISNFETTDYSISGPFACTVTNPPSSTILGMIQPALTDWYKAATRLCATAGPYWWEPCPSSVQVSW